MAYSHDLRQGEQRNVLTPLFPRQPLHQDRAGVDSLRLTHINTVIVRCHLDSGVVGGIVGGVVGGVGVVDDGAIKKITALVG